jgi:hypothetical protein
VVAILVFGERFACGPFMGIFLRVLHVHTCSKKKQAI